MYFYTTPSNCIANSAVTWSGKYNNSDINTTLRAAWATKDRIPIGISKDGRVIYSPTYTAGTVYDDCDVDICNGIMISGQYSYVSTFYHPYVIGCYGPGSTPKDIRQKCSINPRSCGNFDEFENGIRLGLTYIVLATLLGLSYL
jgi:hypothetical protein